MALMAMAVMFGTGCSKEEVADTNATEVVAPAEANGTEANGTEANATEEVPAETNATEAK